MAIATRAELDAMVRERLASNPAWRAALLADPRAELARLTGVPLPEAIRLEIHQETLTHIHLVLPAAPVAGAVSDSDLELVAGGAVSACYYFGP